VKELTLKKNNYYGHNIRSQFCNEFTFRLFDIIADVAKYSAYNEILDRILGYELNWTIDQDDNGSYFLKVKKSSELYHTSEGLGEGIVSLLFMVDAIFEVQKDDVIVIDEPELSLHPQLQIRFLKELLNVSKINQVVISTHSPNMVSLESAINGGVIARIYETDSSSTIREINDECRDFFKSVQNNIFNPHIWGLDARTCLFAEDGIIITEGQEDVVLYPRILEKIGFNSTINFFGFGAGGASNIIKVARMLHCLGFEKIGAIYDGDKVKECKEFNKEMSAFGYKAWFIPADDVRNKEEVKAKPAKDGLLDVEGKNLEHYVSDRKSIFGDIEVFLS